MFGGEHGTPGVTRNRCATLVRRSGGTSGNDCKQAVDEACRAASGAPRVASSSSRCLVRRGPTSPEGVSTAAAPPVQPARRVQSQAGVHANTICWA